MLAVLLRGLPASAVRRATGRAVIFLGCPPVAIPLCLAAALLLVASLPPPAVALLPLAAHSPCPAGLQ